MSYAWQGRGLGWRRDTLDFRDHLFTVPQMLVPATLPLVVDMRSRMPGIYDQGQLSSCTGNAIAAAIEYLQRTGRRREYVPSRLFIYYNERVMENSVASDAGAEIRDGIKSVVKVGVCPESPYPGRTVWPYNEQAVFARPLEDCYKDAATDLVKGYARVEQSVAALEQCLATGFPIVFGAALYESFGTEAVARSGMIPLPQTSEKLSGGHAILLCGYFHNDRHFIVRNSWGKEWGQHGYCLMPYSYITSPDLCGDFWAIRSI
jgi:C1A family cysteine protease